MRIFLSFTSLLWLAACSTVEPDMPARDVLPVTPLTAAAWQVSSLPTDNVVGNYTGAVDARHFYTTRRGVGQRQLLAYERDDGHLAWARSIGGPCDPPVAHGGRVFCAGNDLRAFEAMTGRLLWTALPKPTHSSQRVDIAADAERVYAASNGYPFTDGEIFALDARTGQRLWTRELLDERTSQAVARSLALTPEGDLLVLHSALAPDAPPETWRTVLLALSPQTGTERWRFEDPAPTRHWPLSGLTLWDGLALYSGSRPNNLAALDLSTRRAAWHDGGEPRVHVGSVAPAAANGRVFVGGIEAEMQAFDARTGQRLWTVPGQDRGFSGPVVCGRVVYGVNGWHHLFDAETGRVVGQLLPHDELVGQVAVADGFLYVTAGETVRAVDCAALGS